MTYPYPPQAPAQAYPQQAANYPAPAAYPPAQPFYPPPQGQPAPPVPAPARGTLDDFYDQPSGSGKSVSFANKPPGTTVAGIVARVITNADIRQQTDRNGMPLAFRDGRPKFVMVIPLLVTPSPEFPEGTAAWWVKGQARDELSRAMAEAGAPAGPPEAGAAITITYTGDRQIPGWNAQRIVAVTYRRPQAAASAPFAAGNGQPGDQPLITPPPVQPGPPPPPPVQPQQQQQQQQYQPAEAMPAAALQGAGPAAPPAQQMAMPDGLTPEQQELLAKLTGQQ